MAPRQTPPTTPAAPPPAPDGLVVVALSGGVDSATAAAMLVEQGHRVVGMTMRLYDARGTSAAAGRCCGPRDIEDARAVCQHLGIPFYVVDLAAEFTAAVVDDFVEAYLAGETPNPCVRCNQHIKFTPLLERARAIGADVLATGHYARIAPAPDGRPALHRGVDPGKDQSYFLFSMPPDELGAIRFPLGELDKDEVRVRAARYGLPNAAKAESHEICFVPDGNHAGFVAAAALRKGRPVPDKGVIATADGTVVGHHDGVHRFTIGQHRGLGNLTSRDRLFVVGLEPATGTVVVGPRDAALSTAIEVRDVRWLGPAPEAPFAARVQVRHRGAPLDATVTPTGAGASVRFSDEATVAAPGQAAVFYDRDRVVGGGWVARAADRAALRAG